MPARPGNSLRYASLLCCFCVLSEEDISHRYTVESYLRNLEEQFRGCQVAVRTLVLFCQVLEEFAESLKELSMQNIDQSRGRAKIKKINR